MKPCALAMPLWIGLLLVRMAWAETSASEPLQQVRLELAAARAHHADQVRACHQKLHVNGCLLQAQQAHAEIERPILDRLHALQAAARSVRAERRRAQIQQRAELHRARLKPDAPTPADPEIWLPETAPR